jgi:DNA primase
MNVVRLNEYLSGNADAIEEILMSLGCTNIKLNVLRNEFRCSRDYGKNPSAVRVDIESLRFQCFSTGEQGSIYNFIMSKRNINFPESLRWVVKILKLNKEQFTGQTIIPFGGFYKHLIRSTAEPELAMKTYDDNLLDRYGLVTNLAFLKDGIDLKTQEHFHLGYDHDTDRITIPQWDVNGNLVGIMGRSNDPNIPYEYRWMPIIPCSRSYTLFGYHQNYAAIQQQQMCIITESEKGPMQLRTMGYNFGLATCTRTISSVQERYLKALRVKKLIIAYDEGISEDELRAEAVKLQITNKIYASEVGYIYDRDGDILQKGSKSSPTDLGKETFGILVNKYTKWM